MICAIQCGGEDGPIKFGVASNVRDRLATLQTGNPWLLRLLASAWGNINDETMIHFFLSRERIRGEWFAPTERSMLVVEAIKAMSVDCSKHWLMDLIYERDRKAIHWFRVNKLGYSLADMDRMDSEIDASWEGYAYMPCPVSPEVHQQQATRQQH